MRQHLLAHLLCPGRHTVSGLITVFGGQFEEWTTDYSLYSKSRIDSDTIFGEVRLHRKRVSTRTLNFFDQTTGRFMAFSIVDGHGVTRLRER